MDAAIGDLIGLSARCLEGINQLHAATAEIGSVSCDDSQVMHTRGCGKACVIDMLLALAERLAPGPGEEAAAIPFPKRFTVFNAAQCENLPAEGAAVAPPSLPGLIEPKVEALFPTVGNLGKAAFERSVRSYGAFVGTCTNCPQGDMSAVAGNDVRAIGTKGVVDLPSQIFAGGHPGPVEAPDHSVTRIVRFGWSQHGHSAQYCVREHAQYYG
jgi:hypothetical protein